jgi:two-component system, response regulator
MKTEDYILCIDDDPDDCALLEEAVSLVSKTTKMKFINSGEEAIEYLQLAVQENHFPKLIILDINMPRMNGPATLLEIKKVLTVYVPVLFFTTTPREHDILFGQEYGTALVAKPADLKGYHDIVQTMFRSLVL